MSGPDRRKFPRLALPVFYRSVLSTAADRRRTVNLSLGGVRLYADHAHALGESLELELFLPDHSALVCGAEVVWLESLPMDAPARFEVGVKFVRISPEDQARIAAVLEGHAEPA